MSWTVEKTISGWRAEWRQGDAWASVPLNQYGRVRHMSMCGCDVCFGEIQTIAKRLQIPRWARRHGTRFSDARRIITQELVELLNARELLPIVRAKGAA